jgi:hypothetical protein
VSRPASYTANRAALAIAGAAAAFAIGGCGGVSDAAKQTAAARQTADAKQTAAAKQTVATKQRIAAKTAEAPAPTNKLLATVSTTGREVTLTDSGGHTITHLRSGWYTVFVSVNAAGADFHLTGPSVDSATKAKIPGVALWGIHFLKGAYRYMNDHDALATTHVLSVY